MAVGVAIKGTDKVLDRLKRTVERIEKEVPNRVEAVVNNAASSAQSEYNAAPYDGVKDITVRSEKTGEKTWSVIAEGTTLLFVEFGTGYHYPSDNPLQHPKAGGPASWSASAEGKGFLVGWKFIRFRGFWPIKKGDKVVWVDGNPSANVMYHQTKYIRELGINFIRGAFK